MAKAKKQKKGWIYWTPRIIGLLFVAFLALFSLDVFGEGLTLGETLLALFMHNIPALILLVIVIVAWKHEIAGAIGFALGGIAYIVLLLINPQWEWYMLAWAIQIAGPAFFIAILFYINWKRKR